MKNTPIKQHAFALVPSISKPRSVFQRNRDYKTTMDADYLIPFYHSNVYPGDSVKLRHSLLLRLLSPTIKPIMDVMQLSWFYFFIPYRLIWANFQKFMGEQLSPGDSISYTIPQCTGPNVASGGIPLLSLHDYLGIPVGALSGGGGTTGITFNNLVPRGYNRVFMDWFKDENLQSAITLDTGDGPDTFSNYVLQKRGKRHDYFTSCLPWLQKGGTAVSLPLGTSAPVVTNSQVFTWSKSTGGADTNIAIEGQGAASKVIQMHAPFSNAAADMIWGNQSGLQADLTNATAATINTLRQSIALQQFLENDARGGTRYTEIVRQRWGVVSPDARLQRTELLALGSDEINITAVAQTTPKPASGTTTDQGNLSGFGTGKAIGDGFSKSFTEHGFILGLVCVTSQLSYQQGLDRHWSYRTRYDLFNPEFANLGEQAVLNKEIYANVPDGTGASQKDGVFGYQERNAEDRYSRSMITGNLRSYNGNTVNASTLDVWHLSESYSSLPTLGSTFIKSQVPLDRCVAVPSVEHFIFDAYFRETWARVMPMFGVPGLLRL